ncbi:MAG TPA: hypothetical protein VJQ52_18965, partial [Steroidobacteraceae bacterium]|nr:hypothetical protein [Steroidobacteraceae bacterium]
AGAIYARAWRQACYAVVAIGGALSASRWGLAGIAWAATLAGALDAVLMVQLCCRLGEVRVRDVATALVPGIRVAALIALLIWLLTLGWSALGGSSAHLLVACAAAAAAAIAMRVAPRATLGAHGAEVLEDVARVLPPSLARLLASPA